MPVWKNVTEPLDLFSDYNVLGSYNYEVTVTLNPMLYTRISGDEVGTKILESLQSWLVPTYNHNPYRVQGITIVKEYTKSKMPHFHCCVASMEEIDAGLRSNCIKGLQRLYGRSTFKEVLDDNAYLDYMAKDLEKNLKEKGFSHYVISQFL